MTAYINGFIEWRTTWFILDPSGINSSYEPPQITGFVFFFKSITNNYYKIHFKYVGFIKVT